MGRYCKPSIIAVITARQHSKRLPGKALLDICGKPMLMRVVERLKLSCVKDVIVATDTNSPDIVAMCEENNIKYYAGDEEDQLKRIAEAVPECDYVVRVWGDSPLVDHYIITLLILLIQKMKLTFMHNADFPKGQHVWVAKYKALQRLNRRISEKDRHTFNEIDEIGIWKKNYKWGILRNKTDESEINLSVDNLEDLERARQIWVALEKLQTMTSGTGSLQTVSKELSFA